MSKESRFRMCLSANLTGFFKTAIDIAFSSAHSFMTITELKTQMKLIANLFTSARFQGALSTVLAVAQTL